jgi:DNA (cytosine-5)-methyltransferase 1
MKYFSMFSGIGGFEVGIQAAIPYAECVGFSEVDKYAISIYERHFGGHNNYGDATKINENELPEFDCLVGGFPCQPFSVSGKRGGFEDTRGTLFFDIVRILRAKRPKVFVLENVKGLLSHDGGRTFGVIIKTLDELRYDVQWQVLNCKHHGTPQDRNRVFIVGYSRTCEQSIKKILPIRYSSEKTTELAKQQVTTNTIIKKHADGTRGGSYIVESKQAKVVGNVNPSGKGMNGLVFNVDGIAPTLTTNKGEGIKVCQINQANLKSNNNTQPYQQDRCYDPFGLSPALNTQIEPKILSITPSNTSRAKRVYSPNGVAPCLISKGGGLGAKTGLFAVPVLTPDRLIKRQNGRRFKNDKEPSFCLTKQDKHGVLTNFGIRRLTPIECERLQDFEDDWTKFHTNGLVVSDSQRYACAGNAVNTKVIKVLFDKLRYVLVDKKTETKKLIPSVVSFSGGRSSAMMLLRLLENGDLKQWRGDCVIFNNTSAEHPATYSFVARIKKICEEQYNIPFFMIEYCTYEANTNRGWVRRPAYKLVNSLPYDDITNINGYKFHGEVFEEVISQSGVLPSSFQRECTISMKIKVTNWFLEDWFAGIGKNKQLGVKSDVSNISDDDIVSKHKKYGGELSDVAIIDKKTFVRNCPTIRVSQDYQDFTSASVVFNNSYLSSKVKDGVVPLFGKDAIKYNSYIGIRFDEKHRAERIRKRIKDAKLNIGKKHKNKIKGSVLTQPPYEIAQMPMIKARITKEQVINFWQDSTRSGIDLDLPYDGLMSNCVHCFLKGKKKNQIIAKRMSNKQHGGALSLQWWVDIEEKYARKVIKSTANNYTNIGFFGASKDFVYQSWFDEVNNTDKELIENQTNDDYSMDCNCTD